MRHEVPTKCAICCTAVLTGFKGSPEEEVRVNVCATCHPRTTLRLPVLPIPTECLGLKKTRLWFVL